MRFARQYLTLKCEGFRVIRKVVWKATIPILLACRLNSVFEGRNAVALKHSKDDFVARKGELWLLSNLHRNFRISSVSSQDTVCKLFLDAFNTVCRFRVIVKDSLKYSCLSLLKSP